jgi:hypothetical protein
MAISDKENQKHTYTIETLYHFMCIVCENWWSYATTPTVVENVDLELPQNVTFYCPHCGADEIVELKEGFLPK